MLGPVFSMLSRLANVESKYMGTAASFMNPMEAMGPAVVASAPAFGGLE